MEKKIFGFFSIVLILLICIFGKGIYFYGKYAVPNQAYFGSQYKEILHIMSFQDKRQANEIMAIVDKAFCFVGNKEDADSNYGQLSRYCVTDEESVKEEHDLKLITADFDNDKGNLWFVYNREVFDNKGKTTRASQDILVRATLEKTIKGWLIIDIKEHP